MKKYIAIIILLIFGTGCSSNTSFDDSLIIYDNLVVTETVDGGLEVSYDISNNTKDKLLIEIIELYKSIDNGSPMLIESVTFNNHQKIPSSEVYNGTFDVEADLKDVVALEKTSKFELHISGYYRKVSGKNHFQVQRPLN